MPRKAPDSVHYVAKRGIKLNCGCLFVTYKSLLPKPGEWLTCLKHGTTYVPLNAKGQTCLPVR